jgi:organic radical activating enzyme
MLIKGIIDEDFLNYKKPSMYIATSKCSFKCDKEYGCTVCQNSKLAHDPDLNITAQDLISRYMSNPITRAIVISGMEPFDTPDLIYELVYMLREGGVMDDIVIYTGYTEEELTIDDSGRQEVATYNWLKHYPNIYIKFGRYIPNQKPHYDEVLGVKLASDNQYGKKVSYERIRH